MTKAEQMFRANRIECERHIERWGYETNKDGKAIGFNTVCQSEFDTYSTRTLNDIMKFVEADRKRIELSFKYGVYDKKKYEFKMQALNMIESTVEHSRKVLADIKAGR